MKRLFIALAAVLVLASVNSSAKTKWGVTAGMGFNTAKFSEIDVKARAGWNAGLTLGVDLPLGFSLQPALVYQQKGVNLSDDVYQNMGYLELPVSVQWGPDLLFFRPFLDVTPYVGYALSNKFVADAGTLEITDKSWEGKQRFEYGIGVGGGLDIWKLRLVARYNWNFGSLYNVEGWKDIKEDITGLNSDNNNFGGVTVTLSIFF